MIGDNNSKDQKKSSQGHFLMSMRSKPQGHKVNTSLSVSVSDGLYIQGWSVTTRSNYTIHIYLPRLYAYSAVSFLSQEAKIKVTTPHKVQARNEAGCVLHVL